MSFGVKVSGISEVYWETQQSLKLNIITFKYVYDQLLMGCFETIGPDDKDQQLKLTSSLTNWILNRK
jgi:hypothetical protein